jgi:microcystin-dependent protein
VAGNFIAGPITNTAVAVSNGLFTVSLDFGPGVFTGTNYWVEMGVRTNGTGSFATLVPRQQLTPAPYAMSLVPPQATALCPPGSIVAFAGTVAPPGWLMCNTSLPVSRTTYAALFAAIGTNYGSGDGSATFNLPDFRGRFLRGVDAGAGLDPDSGSRTAMNSGGNIGNAVGSVQGSAFANHNHQNASFASSSHHHFLPFGSDGFGLYGSEGRFGSRGLTIGRAFVAANVANAATTESLSDVPDASATVPGDGGSTETRPVNAYVNYIIKY